VTPESLLTQSAPPWWAALLKSWGLPGVVVIASVAGNIWLVKTDREDRVLERGAFVAALDAQKQAIEQLAAEVRNNTAADAEMRAVWRALYAPDIPPSPRKRGPW
jgi:hypothetical protein